LVFSADKEYMNSDLLLREKCIQLWRAGSSPRTIATTGLSMHPLIREGSTLTFLPAAADRSICIGDIALFERMETLVAHRIVGRFYLDGTLWFREKGDNTCVSGSFPADSLIGRVIKIEHSGHVHDLTALRPCIAGRLIGIYWSALFAILRCAVALKRIVFGVSKTPCLRTCVLNKFRFFSRLPNRFFRQ
jgi:hypothetical protein